MQYFFLYLKIKILQPSIHTMGWMTMTTTEAISSMNNVVVNTTTSITVMPMYSL